MVRTPGIKANPTQEVKPAGLLRGFACVLLFLLAMPVRAAQIDPQLDAPAPNASGAPTGAADGAPPPLPGEPMGDAVPAPSGGATSPDESKVPDIEARELAVKIAKRSGSGRTYLFDDVNDAKTHPGKILLLRRESDPIMAFRVIKLYPEKKQFAAKRVRRYGANHVLDPGDAYMALEKVGDLILPPPTAQDKADLKELEGGQPANSAPPTAPGPEVKTFDPDLDTASSPPPSGAVDSESSKDLPREEDEDPESKFGATVDEVSPLDPNSQWLTAYVGYFINAGGYFAGFGFRYGYSLARMLFLRRPHLQDSLTVEAGVFIYKIVNYETQNDAYTVVPLIGTLRYNILFGENFGIFFYGGIMGNFVTQVVNGDPTVQSALNSTVMAVGTGLLFRVGPSWEARVDLGYDTLGLGLMLRF